MGKRQTHDREKDGVPVPTVAEALPRLRAAVEAKSFTEMKGGLVVDIITASAIVLVHDALSEANRAKFATLDLLRAQGFAMKHVSIGG